MPDINVYVSKGFCHPVISNLPACYTTSSHVQIESMPLFATALQCSTIREYRERKKHSSQVIYFIFNTTNTDQQNLDILKSMSPKKHNMSYNFRLLMIWATVKVVLFESQ